MQVRWRPVLCGLEYGLPLPFYITLQSSSFTHRRNELMARLLPSPASGCTALADVLPPSPAVAAAAAVGRTFPAAPATAMPCPPETNEVCCSTGKKWQHRSSTSDGGDLTCVGQARSRHEQLGKVSARRKTLTRQDVLEKSTKGRPINNTGRTA